MSQRPKLPPTPRVLAAYVLASCFFVAALVSVSLNGCGGDDSTPAPPMGTPDATITIVPGAAGLNLMAFNPATTTVSVNAVVRMTNGDGVTHNIQVPAGDPDWGSIPAGGSVDRTFTAAGTFNFTCVISGHNMNGSVIVQP